MWEIFALTLESANIIKVLYKSTRPRSMLLCRLKIVVLNILDNAKTHRYSDKIVFRYIWLISLMPSDELKTSVLSWCMTNRKIDIFDFLIFEPDIFYVSPVNP